MLRAAHGNALSGHRAENVMHFGRVLRNAGMPVPTDRIQLALNAMQVAGLESRTDFHAVPMACLLDRVEHRELFDQAFYLIWRDLDIAGRMMAMLLPRVQGKTEQAPWPESRRLGGALFPHQPHHPKPPPPPEKIDVDATLTWNRRELPQTADFDTMTTDEWRPAQALLRQMAPLFEPLRTRLTRTTRALRQRDPDIAVAQVAREVQDWSGGTRISDCLHQFNHHWARRVLPGRATVLLISDGLEHGTPRDPRCERLRFEMERLHKSCRRLVWLNPLLRFEQFQPRAAGIRAMLPQVDEFLPAHNLQSLHELAAVLAGSGRRRRR